MKNEFGFVEDLGFVEENPANSVVKDVMTAADVGFTADESANDFEMKKKQDEDAQKQKELDQAKALQAAQAEAADPKNWTLEQTKENFKQQPAQSIDEEAQRNIILDKKKEQVQAKEDEIRQAKPQSLLQSIGDIISRPFVEGPDEKRAKAQNILAISHVYNLPTSTVEKNYDALRAKFINRDPTALELIKTMAIPPIAAGLLANPVATGVGLAGFQGIAEVENAVVSKIKKESFQFFKGRGAKDLLPEEANQLTKDTVELLDFVAQGFGAAKLGHAAPELLERFTKDIVKEYKVPEKLFLKSQTGEDIEVPAEKVVMMAQSKGWAEKRQKLSAAPSSPEEVKARKESVKMPIVQPEPNPQGKQGILVGGQQRVKNSLAVANDDHLRQDPTWTMSAEEKKAQDYVLNKYPEARRRYIEGSVKEFKSKRIVSSDLGKFAAGMEKAEQSVDYHEAGSALAKAREPELLADSRTQDLPVGSTAGGSGSGKSNILKAAAEEEAGSLDKKYALIHDTNFNFYDSAKKKVENAFKSGRGFVLTYVYRDPLLAWADGVIPRVKTQGRIVPINEHIKTHQQSLPTVVKIAEEYRNNPEFVVDAYDNSFAKGEPKNISLDEVPHFDYTDIENKLYDLTKEALNNGKINEAEFRTAIQGSPNLESRAAGEGYSNPRSVSPPGLQETQSQGPTPPRLTPEAPPVPEGLKERKFIETVRESENTAPEVAAKVESYYDPISNKETVAQAQELIQNNPERALDLVEGSGRPTALSNATAIVLVGKAQKEGRFGDAIRLVERTAEKNTEVGQTIQALSIYNRLTPEGILRYATKVVKDARDKMPERARVNAFEKRIKDIKETKDKDELAKKLGVPYIDEPFAKDLFDRATKIQDMPEGREKTLETATMLKNIADKVPVSIGRKISMVQTIGQLLNPKTMIRNLLGNGVFAGMENAADVVGTAIDIATSLKTGERTQYLPSLKTQAGGFARGLKEGKEEALLGVDLKTAHTKFDLPRNSVFNSGVMGALEKTMRVGLQAPDRAFYQAGFNESLRNQMVGKDLAEPTAEMIERAHYEGLYRTFQDDNVVSRVFVDLKKALNARKDFGLGDIVIKYPKTPGNLLARGIEYSPLGFIQTAFKIAEPFLGREFKQGEFVKFTARALTGSALYVGAGIILANLGIISGRRDKDKDVAATKEAVGLREYQVNASALKRFVLSGLQEDQAKLQEDDTMVTYDWMQPVSIGLALGANMAIEKDKSVVDKTINLAERIFQASETLAEQPLVQGLKVLSGKQSITEGMAATVQGIPASFVPTFLNQIRQLTDNTARNTRDPNYFKEMYDRAIMRIPGVSSQLPAKVTALGEEKEMYQGGTNSPFNVFLNPAFVSKYKPDPVSRMVLDIWQNSGQTVHFPRVASNKVKLGAENLELTGDQYHAFQSYIGLKTDILFQALANNKKFMSIPDEIKAKKLQGFLTDINTAAKIQVLGYRPKNVSGDVVEIIKRIAIDKAAIDRAGQKEDDGFIREEGQ